MTDRPTPSSTPILSATVRWGAIVDALLLVVAAIAGLLAAGWTGLWSAVAGVLLAAVFLVVTAVSILVANRWFGDPLYVPIFFGIVLGGWIVKLVLFIVALVVLRGQPWIEPTVFFLAVVAAVVASLVVDVVVLARMRIPYVSDARLPGEGEGTGPSPTGDS